MPSANALGMIDLADMAWPMTFRFHLSTNWGLTYQELTLDIPSFRDHLEATAKYAYAVWSGFIATAISRSVVLEFAEVVEWKRSPLPQLLPPSFPSGGNSSTPAKMEESGVLVLHTSGTDSYSRRRFYLPGMPRDWQDNKRLNDRGFANIYDWVSILHMAYLAPEKERTAIWYLAYPRVVDTDPSNLVGVAFRLVEWVRICNHCSKPPEGAGTDWP